VLACLCFVVALFALSNWLVQILMIGPRNLIDTAENARYFPSNLKWDPAINLVKSVEGAIGYDARVQFELGRMLRFKTASEHVDSNQARAVLLDSASHLWKAVRLRPMWGTAWAELAHVQLMLGVNDLARVSLRNAALLSGYDGSVQSLLLWDGFALWEELDQAEQQQLLKVAEHVLEFGPKYWLLDPASAYYRDTVVSPLLEDYPSLQKRFEKMTSSRKPRNGGS